MLGIKKWITGGHLVIPEYDVALEISDGSMCLFDGQAHIHGVTPIKKLNPKMRNICKLCSKAIMEMGLEFDNLKAFN